MDCVSRLDDWWTNDKLKHCLDSIDENVDFIYHELKLSDSNQDLI